MKEENINEYFIKIKSISTNQITTHKLTTIEGRYNSHIIWTIKLEFVNRTIRTKSYYYLSDALNEVRKEIEHKGYRIGVRWAEKNAIQTGMLSDMSAGATMYYTHEVDEVNKNPNENYKPYFILEEGNFKYIVTREKQLNHTIKWRKKYGKTPNPIKTWIKKILNKKM